MNIKHHTSPDKLERYSFLWSEARLIIAAVALAVLNGYPPALALIAGNSSLYGIVRPLLTLSWIVSGAAAIYLLYRWNGNGQKLFGGKSNYDMYAFFIMIISGLNLGLTGIIGYNLGMSIASGRLVFLITGILYVASAYHLYNRWKKHGEKVF